MDWLLRLKLNLTQKEKTLMESWIQSNLPYIQPPPYSLWD